MSFYGSERRFPPTETVFPGVTTPQALYRALLACWCAETCTPRMRDRWTEDDPTLGQCSVTAFLAQDLFGGEVYGIPRPDGSFHCYNVVHGRAFDLTSEQFHGEALDYSENPLQRREEHFSKCEKYERYLLLRQRLEAWTGGKRND